jgi:hypothetical protein
MRGISLIGRVLAIALVGLAVSCGSDPVSRVPSAPGAPAISGLQLNGPSTIPPGQSAQFSAQLRMSDGTVKSSLTGLDVRWRTNSPALQVNSAGVVTAPQNNGDAVLTAELVSNPSVRGAREIIILPNGTFRVVGSIREADSPTQPIAGALVRVNGTNLAATTDSNGNYRLYGVPPTAEIQVSANGYQPAGQNIQLTAHATQNFTLALSGPRISLNGPFTLAIDATGACAGNPPLPGDLQHRTYDATVTTTGPTVRVQLTESPRFRTASSRGDWFIGRADALGVTFTLDSFYYYFFYSTYPSVAEQLPNNTYLVPSGRALTSQTSSGVSGPLDGGSIINYDAGFPSFNTRFLGSCFSNLRFSLTRR